MSALAEPPPPGSPTTSSPASNETRDRIITGTSRSCRSSACSSSPGRSGAHWLGWNDIFVFLIMYVLTGAGHHGRLPPPVHAPRVQDVAVHARRVRRARLGRDRGPGDLLGRRPPQAPRVLRPPGRPAQPARRPRLRPARRDPGPRPRARRLALPAHASRPPQPLRARPDRRPRGQRGRPPFVLVRRRRPASRRSCSAGRSAARCATASPACCGAAPCASSSCTTRRTRSTRSATSSAAASSRRRTSRATCCGSPRSRWARRGTTTTTRSRPRPRTGCGRWEIDPSACVISGHGEGRPRVGRGPHLAGAAGDQVR